MIEICNLRNEKMKFAYDFRIDRASILGNPFFMKDESMRNEVCDRYDEYFHKKLLLNNKALLLLNNMYEVHKKYGKLRLFCWCAPRRCHGETIKKFLEMEV